MSVAKTMNHKENRILSTTLRSQFTKAG